MGGRGDRSKERQPAKRLHDTQHTDNTRRSPDTGKLVATQHPPRPAGGQHYRSIKNL